MLKAVMNCNHREARPTRRPRDGPSPWANPPNAGSKVAAKRTNLRTKLMLAPETAQDQDNRNVDKEPTQVDDSQGTGKATT